MLLVRRPCLHRDGAGAEVRGEGRHVGRAVQARGAGLVEETPFHAAADPRAEQPVGKEIAFREMHHRHGFDSLGNQGKKGEVVR